MGKHSKLLSPSASGIWTHCTAQPQALVNANFPYETSPAAELGTWKHDLAEEMFLGLLDKDEKPEAMDQFDWNEVLIAVREAESFLPKDNETVKVYTEMEVSFDGWREDCFGTADLVAYDIGNKKLYIGDYKFGRVSVPVEGNTQLMIYALAAICTLEKELGPIYVDHIELAIIQPKVQHDAMTIEMTRNELGEWEQSTLIPAQKAILENKGTEFVAGPWCAEKYCNLQKAGICPKAIDKVEEFTQSMLEMKDLSIQDNLPRFIELMKHDSFIKKMLSTAFAVATEAAKNGAKVEGFKLVKGKGKRAWADETKAAAYMKGKLKHDEIFTKKIITGPQAEIKLQQAGKLEHPRSQTAFQGQLVYLEGALTLVPEDHPKPAIKPKTSNELEEHYGTEEAPPEKEITAPDNEVDEADAAFDELF